jgi:hypothetical protein
MNGNNGYNEYTRFNSINKVQRLGVSRRPKWVEMEAILRDVDIV